MIKKICVSALVVFCLMVSGLWAVPVRSSAGQTDDTRVSLLTSNVSLPVAPPDGLTASDMPYDAGGAVLLQWKAMPYDNKGVFYRVVVSSSIQGPWFKAAEFAANGKMASDIRLPFWAWKASDDRHAVPVDLTAVFGEVLPKNICYFKVTVLKDGNRAGESAIVAGAAKGNWFNLTRLNNLICVIIISGGFLWMIFHAGRKEFFIRRIAGLDAATEAVRRAAETGRPVFFFNGTGSMADMSTIASTFVLGEISKKAAVSGAAIKVPHYDPVVMSVCREVAKQACLDADRPDFYREDMNFFVSQDRFSYAASVDGMISREKPAVCFFMGRFMAESLLLTEVGSATGVMQIAGTDAETQLPFFFTSCDYTLIGEELYAAGAYLSRKPVLVGTLRAQDIGKMLVMTAVAAGLIVTTLGTVFGGDTFVDMVMNLFHSY
ncbi:MAG: DUF6754 domain-containing protein [bacterium]